MLMKCVSDASIGQFFQKILTSLLTHVQDLYMCRAFRWGGLCSIVCLLAAAAGCRQRGAPPAAGEACVPFSVCCLDDASPRPKKRAETPELPGQAVAAGPQEARSPRSPEGPSRCWVDDAWRRAKRRADTPEPSGSVRGWLEA